jgi:hypothetical protein
MPTSMHHGLRPFDLTSGHSCRCGDPRGLPMIAKIDRRVNARAAARLVIE